MMVAPATALGIDLILFANEKNDPGAQIAHHILGDYTNLEEVLAFARNCDLLTLEHGSVPLSVIKGLEVAGIKVYPSSTALSYSRDKERLLQMLSQSQPQVRFAQSEELHKYDSTISATVARSPHGQAASWAPVESRRIDGVCVMTIAPAQRIPDIVSERSQQIALEIAQLIGLVGVMSVEMFIQGDEIYIGELDINPSAMGNWSIDGAVTSQFEQHLRAILDLPLGSPDMTYPFVVMGVISGGEKKDMYRPYLHLMARSPSLHFHQYRNEVKPGVITGHVTACGSNLTQLVEEIEHARDYMSGLVEE
jgi:5-(carboxyamino)imidazole ribonucleotide synthase